MRWLFMLLLIVTMGAESQPRISAEFLVDLFKTCSEDRWIVVPGHPDVEVTCVSRKTIRI